MVNLKTLFSQTATKPETTRVRVSMGIDYKDTAPTALNPSSKTLYLVGLILVDDQIAVTIDLRFLQMALPSLPNYKIDSRRNHPLGMRKDIVQKVKECISFLATNKSLKRQKLNGEVSILIAIERISNRPTAKICKTTENKEVISFSTRNFSLNGIPEKIRPDIRIISLSRVQQFLEPDQKERNSLKQWRRGHGTTQPIVPLNENPKREEGML